MFQVCNTTNLTLMFEPNQCKNFHVLPINDFYAVNFTEYKKFFEPEYADEVMHQLKYSVITHLWNAFSAGISLTIDSKAAYIDIAKIYCPKTVAASKDYF
jgi:lactosylceramide 4-alpha-galactosyltransferase